MEEGSERLLLSICAPTLAGIKTGSLFRLPGSPAETRAKIKEWNGVFVSRGVCVLALRTDTKCALLYVYREKLLHKDWVQPGVAVFLKGYGYTLSSTGVALGHLAHRIVDSGNFPHEIGLFLGYPLMDVQGFIENCGQNYCLCGYWKVYSNPDEAARCFARYKKCKSEYLQRYEDEHSLSRLTVVI